MTNEERIGLMNTREKAKFLFENSTKPIICSYMQPKTNCNCTCAECFEQWLESEAEKTLDAYLRMLRPEQCLKEAHP
jgi:hypothetical protein